jgi:hypothetical protein
LRTCGVRSDAGTGTGALALYALQSSADADVTETNHAYLVKLKAELALVHMYRPDACSAFQQAENRWS